MERTEIVVFDYDGDHIREQVVASVDECLQFRDAPTMTWVDVVGLHDVEVLRKIGECFDIHPLVLEDILNTEQRPKIEISEDALFIVLKMLSVDERTGEVMGEQISLVVGRSFLISFQEAPGDVFENVRKRLRDAHRRIRERGTDYLAYTLLDAIVDNYFFVLESLGERIEGYEDELMDDPQTQTLRELYKLKREAIFLRKSVWPVREVLSVLGRGDSKIVEEGTLPYVRDVYDHTIQVIDTVESFRDLIAGMHDTYLSNVSNKMNEVMKVLTVFASIFIPLTFLTGLYGMNFDYMPELHWHWSYPVLLVTMLVVGVGMAVHFYKRGWL